jgi:hypothetical protein
MFTVLHKILLPINQPNEQIGHIYCIRNTLVMFGEIMENVHMILNEKQVKMWGQCIDGRMTLKEVLENKWEEGNTWI